MSLLQCVKVPRCAGRNLWHPIVVLPRKTLPGSLSSAPERLLSRDTYIGMCRRGHAVKTVVGQGKTWRGAAGAVVAPPVVSRKAAVPP